MKPSGRLSVILLAIGVLFVMLTLPALAQEEEGGGDSPTTTVAESSGLEPAVPMNDEEPAPPIPDWTYRYLIPTTVVLGLVVILITSIQYFTSVVRKRYRIVEE